MKKDKYLAVWLSIACLLTGGYILQDSIVHPGAFAEEWILIGAVLASCSLAAIGWFVKLQGNTRAMHRHMRGH